MASPQGFHDHLGVTLIDTTNVGLVEDIFSRLVKNQLLRKSGPGLCQTSCFSGKT